MSKNYIDNKDFSEKVIRFNELCNIYKDTIIEKDDLNHKIVKRNFKKGVSSYIKKTMNLLEEEIVKCINMIVHKTITSRCFAIYTGTFIYDEMISVALSDCISNIYSFDPSRKTFAGKPNAFGCFTFITSSAFKRTLKKNKVALNANIIASEAILLTDLDNDTKNIIRGNLDIYKKEAGNYLQNSGLKKEKKPKKKKQDDLDLEELWF